MVLSNKQKSNIRFFAFYLVNGTLDFELIQQTFGNTYQNQLKSNPDLFYKTACVFINEEVMLNPDWPYTKKLGKFVCQLYNGNINIADFEDWEIAFDTEKADYSSDFKNFTKWFINSRIVPDIAYINYIEDGASFAEQCFAIWGNVVKLKNNRVTNNDYAMERVEQYIKSYYIPGYKNNLKEWECELHME